MVLIPLLDVLQSVPVLGFLSFTVTFFLGVFPGSTLGPECAAIFAIFTSQAWNMAFSFYQSLRTVPRDLDEVARGFRLICMAAVLVARSPLRRPGSSLEYDDVDVGRLVLCRRFRGHLGRQHDDQSAGRSALIWRLAIDQRRVDAVIAAVVAMFVVILVYDQLLFRPVVAWAGKFRVELSASQTAEESWALRIFQRTRWLRALAALV